MSNKKCVTHIVVLVTHNEAKNLVTLHAASVSIRHAAINRHNSFFMFFTSNPYFTLIYINLYRYFFQDEAS